MATPVSEFRVLEYKVAVQRAVRSVYPVKITILSAYVGVAVNAYVCVPQNFEIEKFS